LRRRYYIIFVAREKDGPVRKIPIPLHYAGVFVAAAVVGMFTITGMAGSYTRMLMKTAAFDQVRSQREALRQDYQRLQVVAHEKDLQAASLGSLASQVSALYGLRQGRLARTATAPVAPGSGDDPATFTEQAYVQSLNQLSLLRTDALDGELHRFNLSTTPSLVEAILPPGAPELWPVMGPITSSFGEREDPLNVGEGEFHTGVDIGVSFGTPVRATADGIVAIAGMATGYGREVILDHGNGIETLYAHLSGFTVTPGQQVSIGQVIGYVGLSGRTTGPNLHYEVRIRNTPVNPHKYMRETMQQLATADPITGPLKGGN
jgi:murein DD-endopeptidase MepM/ murein hydrolase activator NlpD